MLYFRENPPINEHLNNVGANIAYTVYNCNTTKRSRKLKFKDFKLNYKRSAMTQEERLAEDFAQFERENPSLFKVV